MNYWGAGPAPCGRGGARDGSEMGHLKQGDQNHTGYDSFSYFNESLPQVRPWAKYFPHFILFNTHSSSKKKELLSFSCKDEETEV